MCSERRDMPCRALGPLILCDRCRQQRARRQPGCCVANSWKSVLSFEVGGILLCIVSISTETKNQLSISSDTNFKITSLNINYICHFLSLCNSLAVRRIRLSIHIPHLSDASVHRHMKHSHRSPLFSVYSLVSRWMHRRRRTMHWNRISKFTLTYFVN